MCVNAETVEKKRVSKKRQRAKVERQKKQNTNRTSAMNQAKKNKWCWGKKNKVYKTISIEMVLVENEIFPLRKYNKSHLLLDGWMYVLLRISCAFHCFIFPKRNELLNWYVRRSILFSRSFSSSSIFLHWYWCWCCCFSSSSDLFFPVPSSCTMPFVPFFISFGHYLLYATQWRFSYSFVFLSFFVNRHVLFVCHRFPSISLWDVSVPKYALRSWGDGNSDNQKQSKWKWEKQKNKNKKMMLERKREKIQWKKSLIKEKAIGKKGILLYSSNSNKQRQAKEKKHTAWTWDNEDRKWKWGKICSGQKKMLREKKYKVNVRNVENNWQKQQIP